MSSSADSARASVAGWTSTRTAAEVAGALRAARSALVFTHARPDGDALGSTLALTRSLRLLGVDARAVYVPPVPRWAGEIIGDTPHIVPPVGGVAAALAAVPEPEAIVVMDTGAWVQVDEVAAWLRAADASGRARTAKTVVIDHHLSGDCDMAAARLLDTAAAAAAEIAADVCAELHDLQGDRAHARLPRAIAEPLYLGLATDTGWFKYSNTRPNTLRVAASLLETGIDSPRLYQLVEQQSRAARLRLQGRALQHMELHARDSIAILSLTQRDFEECHGDSEDTTGFASDVLSVASVQVGALLIEMAGRDGKGPMTKASLRSKPGPNAVDVAALTRELGGGGHARAAGVKLAMPLLAAKAALVAALLKGG